MIIELAPPLDALVEERVESGRYVDASAVIGEALRLLEEQRENSITCVRPSPKRGPRSRVATSSIGRHRFSTSFAAKPPKHRRTASLCTMTSNRRLRFAAGARRDLRGNSSAFHRGVGRRRG